MSWCKDYQTEWKKIIEAISNDIRRDSQMIEKDTIQSIFLYRLSKSVPDIVFKGGTSLSKVYKVIDRFSEDIDLSLPYKATSGIKRLVHHSILDVAKSLNLTLTNIDDVQSRHSYNKYVFQYDSLFFSLPLEIIVETNFYIPVYPISNTSVHCMVNEYVTNNNLIMPIPFTEGMFNMNVQNIERTFIDKVFAVCDYRLQNMEDRDSRHLYDIAKMLPLVEINDDLLLLAKKVRVDRAASKNNPSAQPEHDIKKLLNLIIDTRFYESDYRNITSKLLYESMSYDEAIENGIGKLIKYLK